VTRRLRCAVVLFVIAVLSSTAALAANTVPSPSRFAIDAEVRPLAISADGRFALDASARYAPEAKSADGRFALKAVNVPSGGCEALPDALFSNGFEAP